MPSPLPTLPTWQWGSALAVVECSVRVVGWIDAAAGAAYGTPAPPTLVDVVIAARDEERGCRGCRARSRQSYLAHACASSTGDRPTARPTICMRDSRCSSAPLQGRRRPVTRRRAGRVGQGRARSASVARLRARSTGHRTGSGVPPPGRRRQLRLGGLLSIRPYPRLTVAGTASARSTRTLRTTVTPARLGRGHRLAVGRVGVGVGRRRMTTVDLPARSSAPVVATRPADPVVGRRGSVAGRESAAPLDATRGPASRARTDLALDERLRPPAGCQLCRLGHDRRAGVARGAARGLAVQRRRARALAQRRVRRVRGPARARFAAHRFEARAGLDLRSSTTGGECVARLAAIGAVSDRPGARSRRRTRSR